MAAARLRARRAASAPTPRRRHRRHGGRQHAREPRAKRVLSGVGGHAESPASQAGRMRHFSIRIASRLELHCMSSRIVIVAVAIAPFAYAADLSAQTAPGAAPDLAPRLKLAPTLEPPSPKAFRPGAPTERDAIFLRADRLEGDGKKWIEGEGKVELRTRRQTVLADWLHYDIETEEFWGKGNVILWRGVDWITGPEAKFKRGDETGFFTSPVFHIGENASRGDAREIIFAGTDKYELKDFRYTTCVAGNDDWY